MSTSAPGTFAPRPGAAPFPRQVRAQAAMEARLLLRSGEQLLLAVVIPLLVLVGGVVAVDRVGLGFEAATVDTLTPGVLALAVLSTSFTSLAIATGFERRYGVLKRLGAAPLPRVALLAGKVVALLLVELLQVLVVAGAALVLGWSPRLTAAAVLGFAAAVLLGTAAFAALGLFLAGTLRAEATLATANLVYLLLLVAGGVVLPASSYGPAAGLLHLLPSGALGEAMRSALVDGTVALPPLLVLASWAAAGTLLTARTFAWE